MFSTRRITTTCLLSFFVVFASPAMGQMRKVNIAYTSTSPYSAPLIVAKEAELFKKYGIDPTLILTPGGSLGFQAMMGGDVAMVLGNPAAAVTSNVAGADMVVIASLQNTFPFNLVSVQKSKKSTNSSAEKSPSADSVVPPIPGCACP